MGGGYDPLDRLMSATYSDGQGLIYVYDAAGNRLRNFCVDWVAVKVYYNP